MSVPIHKLVGAPRSGLLLHLGVLTSAAQVPNRGLLALQLLAAWWEPGWCRNGWCTGSCCTQPLPGLVRSCPAQVARDVHVLPNLCWDGLTLFPAARLLDACVLSACPHKLPPLLQAKTSTSTTTMQPTSMSQSMVPSSSCQPRYWCLHSFGQCLRTRHTA